MRASRGLAAELAGVRRELAAARAWNGVTAKHVAALTELAKSRGATAAEIRGADPMARLWKRIEEYEAQQREFQPNFIGVGQRRRW